MGVWIETETKAGIIQVTIVTPCMGVWIETEDEWADHWAWTRHTLYGCVDWNTLAELTRSETAVTPCMGVWIETPTRAQIH